MMKKLALALLFCLLIICGIINVFAGEVPGFKDGDVYYIVNVASGKYIRLYRLQLMKVYT